MKYFIPMSGKYMKYFIALSYKFVCCVLSQADDAAGLRETESKLKFLLDCSSAFQRQSFSQRKHIQPKRNLGKNKLILSAFLEFLPALYSGENLSTEIQFLTAMISQRKIFLAVWKRIFNNQYFGYYTCCFVPHFCKVEDVLWQTFFGHIFISIVLLFVRMPSLAFSSATCQEEWGWCWQFGPGPTWLHPVPSHRPQIWLHSRQKSTPQGLEIFEIHLLITDHWSDFLDILSECFFLEGLGLHDVSLLENLFENCGNTSRSKMKESWVGPLGVFGPPQPQIIFLLERDWIFFTILPSSAPPTFCKLLTRSDQFICKS